MLFAAEVRFVHPESLPEMYTLHSFQLAILSSHDLLYLVHAFMNPCPMLKPTEWIQLLWFRMGEFNIAGAKDKKSSFSVLSESFA